MLGRSGGGVQENEVPWNQVTASGRSEAFRSVGAARGPLLRLRVCSLSVIARNPLWKEFDFARERGAEFLVTAHFDGANWGICARCNGWTTVQSRRCS